MVHACDPSTWEIEAEESEIQDHDLIHTESNANLEYEDLKYIDLGYTYLGYTHTWYTHTWDTVTWDAQTREIHRPEIHILGYTDLGSEKRNKK